MNKTTHSATLALDTIDAEQLAGVGGGLDRSYWGACKFGAATSGPLAAIYGAGVGSAAGPLGAAVGAGVWGTVGAAAGCVSTMGLEAALRAMHR